MTWPITNSRGERQAAFRLHFGASTRPQDIETTEEYFQLRILFVLPGAPNFAPEMSQKLLHFVQRGRILLRCGSAFALSLPSLGVSSLDLGRLFIQAALFSFRRYWRLLGRAGIHTHFVVKYSLMRNCTSKLAPGARMVTEIYYSAAAWNGPRSPSGTAASASARLAKSEVTCANRAERSRRRSSM
jgi:hypothetical protein